MVNSDPHPFVQPHGATLKDSLNVICADIITGASNVIRSINIDKRFSTPTKN